MTWDGLRGDIATDFGEAQDQHAESAAWDATALDHCGPVSAATEGARELSRRAGAAVDGWLVKCANERCTELVKPLADARGQHRVYCSSRCKQAVWNRAHREQVRAGNRAAYHRRRALELADAEAAKAAEPVKPREEQTRWYDWTVGRWFSGLRWRHVGDYSWNITEVMR